MIMQFNALDFIKNKKIKEFEFCWEKLLEMIPTYGKRLTIGERNFRKQLLQKKETLIISTSKEDGIKVVLNKNDFLEPILNTDYFTETKKEIVYAHRFDYEPDDLVRDLYRLKTEEEIIKILTNKGGCSYTRIKKIDRLKLDDLYWYVDERRQKARLSLVYFEFLSINKTKLKKAIYKRKKINQVLIGERFKDFVSYCEKAGLRDLFDLLLIPYYSQALVNKFGVKTVQDIINTIVVMIDILSNEPDEGFEHFKIEDLL